MSYNLPTLSSLARLPRLATTALADLPASRRVAKPLGRGPGTGKGKTAARGHKGQGKYSSGKGPGFEGGQTPMHRLLPKVGFTNVFRVDYQELNLASLQRWVDQGRLDPTRPVTQQALVAAGLVSSAMPHGIKLLAGGAPHFASPVHVEVARASRAAIDAVEKAGGSVLCVYRPPTSLRAHLQPSKFPVPPRPARPTKPKVLQWYSNWANRGYLAPEAPKQS